MRNGHHLAGGSTAKRTAIESLIQPGKYRGLPHSNCHMARKLKLVPSPTCPCKEADQTAEHVLQTCPHFSAIRAKIWPEGETLETKLYGCYQDLEKTTLFISRTGLTV